MSFKHLNKIILAIFLVIFAINLSLATEFETKSHDSDGSLSPGWMPEMYSQNVTFLVNSNATSLDNITTIEIFNFITSNEDLFNITYLYCPSGWISTTFERELTKDNITDSAYCSGGNLLNGSSVNVVLTIMSKNIPDNTTSFKDWTLITTDTGTSNTTDYFSLFAGIDAKGPAITFLAPTSPIGNNNFTFNVTVNEGEVKVDNLTAALSSHVIRSGVCANATVLNQNLDCNAAQNLCYYSFDMDASSGNGQCNVTVRFNDTFNNTGSGTNVYKIDNTGPVIELTSGSELRSGSLVTFNITDSPAGVNDSWWTNDPGVTNYTLGAGIDTTGWLNGNHTITVWANDTLGNLGDKITSGGTNSTSITVIIDGIAPNVTIVKPIAGYFGNIIPVNVTVEDDNNVSSVKAIINGTETLLNRTSGTEFWTGNVISSGIANGTYTLTINASDRAGNYNDSETVSGIIIDHTKPVIIILDPDEDEIITSSATTVNANVNENALDCTANFDSLDNVTMTSTDRTNWTFSKSLKNGNHVVKVYCADIAGNWNVTDSVNFDVYVTSGGGGSGGIYINTTAALEIENHKPELTAPSIDNEVPKKGDMITCISGKFSDIDGDSKAGEQWKWFVNGKAVSGSSDKFNTNDANVGDTITCSQRATDGIDYSDWSESSNSAVVQEPLKSAEQTAAAAKTEDTKKPLNPFTGAFIGGLLGDNIFLTIMVLVLAGGSIAVLAIRFIKRRGIKFKVE